MLLTFMFGVVKFIVLLAYGVTGLVEGLNGTVFGGFIE